MGSPMNIAIGADHAGFALKQQVAEGLRAAGVSVEVIPGITAAQGAASSTHIPLTHRDHAQSCIFVTGHLKDGTMNLDWAQLARPRRRPEPAWHLPTL